MEPTVELAINSSTGAHKIEIVFDSERYPLSSKETARLIADAGTVLAFALGGESPAQEEVRPKKLSAAQLSSVPDTVEDEEFESDEADFGEEPDDHEPVQPKIVWHRRAPGSGEYVAKLPVKDERGKEVTARAYQKPNSKGWNIRISMMPRWLGRVTHTIWSTASSWTSRYSTYSRSRQVGQKVVTFGLSPFCLSTERK